MQLERSLISTLRFHLGPLGRASSLCILLYNTTPNAARRENSFAIHVSRHFLYVGQYAVNIESSVTENSGENGDGEDASPKEPEVRKF
jgi:hypothetical protein